jgi:hypothetical protein
MHLHALGPEKAAVSRRLLEHGHRVTYDCLHRWLNTLAAEGHLDPSETAPAATALFTTIDGIALHSIITPETMTVDAAHEQLKWTIGRILGL